MNTSQVVQANSFQFPSNGNAYRKSVAGIASRVRMLEFQFPSNGNADRKDIINGRVYFKSCFYSLHTGTRIASRNRRLNQRKTTVGFYSLQTGKRIASLMRDGELVGSGDSFNSLQTGTRIASRTYPTTIMRR